MLENGKKYVLKTAKNAIKKPLCARTRARRYIKISRARVRA